MKLPAAPLLRRNVGDGFREVPTVSEEILHIVLALAIVMFLGFAQNNGPIFPRSLAVPDRILNTNLNVLRMVGRHVTFSDREAAVACFHLNAVVGNAQSNRESKCPGQPVSSDAGIRVDEHRNDTARRHRPVKSHPETLSLGPAGGASLCPEIRSQGLVTH
jgi:hypothetical protein